MCPFRVARVVGKCVLTCLEVSAGQETKWPASMALHHVDMVGENRAAW